MNKISIMEKYRVLRNSNKDIMGLRPSIVFYDKWKATFVHNMLNRARRTSRGWWDEWDDTALQTQDSKFKPWRPETEHATSRSRRLPTILSFTSGWGRNIFVSFKPRPGNEPRTLVWKAAVLTTTLGAPPSTINERVTQPVQVIYMTTDICREVVTFVVGNHDNVVTFVVGCDICRGKVVTFVVDCDILWDCDICRHNNRCHFRLSFRKLWMTCDS